MERVRPIQMKGTFLRLADGRGWALDFLDGRQVLQRVTAGQDSVFSPLLSFHSVWTVTLT